MIRTTLAFVALLTATHLSAQEMRFVIEQSCFSTGSGLNFKCKKENKEFTLDQNGKKFTGINPSGGMFKLKLLEMTQYIIVLQNPVGFDGTSMIHITPTDKKFYWSEVAYSTILNEREVTIQSGRRLP